MGRSKKKKTTQEDLQKDSQSNWWSDCNMTITQDEIEAYLMWIEGRKDNTDEKFLISKLYMDAGLGFTLELTKDWPHQAYLKKSWNLGM